jgi:hypothetical protein
VCWYKTIDTNSFTGEDLCYRRFLNREHNLSHPPTECPDNSYSKCAIIVPLWTWQTICVMVYSHRGCRYSINITEDTTLHQHHSVGCSPPHRHTVHGECAVSANDNDWGFGTTWLEDTSSPYIRLPHLFASPCVAQLWAAFPKAKAPCSEGILPRVWEGGYLFLIGHDSIDWTPNALDRSWTSSSLLQPPPWTSCGFDQNLGWYCLLRIGRRHMCRLKPPQDTVSCSFEWLWSLGENALKGWGHLLWIGGRHMCRLKPPWWDHFFTSEPEKYKTKTPTSFEGWGFYICLLQLSYCFSSSWLLSPLHFLTSSVQLLNLPTSTS